MQNTTTTLTLSNGLIISERLGFYLLMLYLIPHLSSEEVRLNEFDVMPLLVLLMNAGAFARIFGGLIIDFLTGVRFGLQLSLGLQLLGVVLLTRADLNLIYLGIIPYVLGQGLFMPAILKWNALQANSTTKHLPFFNYSNYFIINLSAILIFILQHFIFKNEQVPILLLFVLPMISMAVTFFLQDKKQEDLLQIGLEKELTNRSNRHLSFALIGFVVFFFLFNIVNKKSSIAGNVYENLSSLGKYPNTEKLMLLVICVSLAPSLIMFFVSKFKSISTSLFSGIFFAFSACTSIGLFILSTRLTASIEMRLTMVMLHMCGEGFISPILIAMIQKNANIKHVGTWIGVALSFSGFTSIYIGNKLFNLDGVVFGMEQSVDLRKILIIAISGFLLFSGLFMTLYIRKKGGDVKQFEDLSEL